MTMILMPKPENMSQGGKNWAAVPSAARIKIGAGH